ncbi:MAG: c-type cytochrome [Acidobacteriales bacterium]|nr:c-type cytochrome [Terriglobales bacterium]
MRHSLRLSALLIILALSSPAQMPEKFTNLQVLPKDIKRAQLIDKMKSFAMGLGVRCPFCHVGEEGKPLSTFDFATDDKPNKAIARKMLAMVMEINTKHLPNAGLDEPIEISCYTCHRGSKEPALTSPMPPPPPAGQAPGEKPKETPKEQPKETPKL